MLVPAFHHGSEVEALSTAGIECRFYDAATDLQPDRELLESLIDDQVKALYLIHYLGLPQDSRKWRQWCNERNLLLIEDAAQAWLATTEHGPVGSFGDLSLFCLYKTFGLPDGAAILSQRPPLLETDHRTMEAGRALARTAAWLEGRSGWVSRMTTTLRTTDDYDPARDFSLGDGSESIAESSLRLLPRVADEEAAARRRANYRILLEELGAMVVAPFDELPEGASPFAFPIESDDKAALLRRLAKANVAGLNLWSIPHPSLNRVEFPNATARRQRTVCLPVHQELRQIDLERLVDATQPVRRPASSFVEYVDDPAQLRKQWETLALRTKNVFATYEWAMIWADHFLAKRPLLVGAGRSADGEIFGVFPLYLWAGKPMRVVRFLGHGPGDQLGPVCDPRDAPRAARALAASLKKPPWDYGMFIGDYLRRDEGWGHLLGAKVLRRFESPLLKFDGSWDDFLNSRSSNLREQIRRRERKLLREHDVRFRLADDLDRLPEDMATLFSLYDARWAATERTFSAGAAFHRDFALEALKKGWLRLWFLELDGGPVAAWYGFRYAGVESYYQAGRDPSFEGESVGFVLLVHTIREALNDGVTEYRLLRGGEAYKYRFATEDPGLETIAWGRGPMRAGLSAAARLGEWGPTRRLLGRKLASLPRSTT
ncbi:MAG: bifunctional aminotransferase class I/II-fold pyridoxal phosphate-dependent enzyme/GNAT family N-acetyltransferase [Actinomycetota bacterium]|nr:bifunctional aminotransferase class I/II-fold pyridoxal phosphate-dependent enzyme/GNAT family N-acetyltransferase [Actinomycetota bacterium]